MSEEIKLQWDELKQVPIEVLDSLRNIPLRVRSMSAPLATHEWVKAKFLPPPVEAKETP